MSPLQLLGREPRAAVRSSMFLVLSLRADSPRAPSYRFPLGAGIVIGRGAEVMAYPAGPARLRVAVPDPAISRQHVELKPDPVDPYAIAVNDLGSTNGIFVQGAPVHQARLRAGGLLEVGSCFFVVCHERLGERIVPGSAAFASTVDPALERDIVRFASDGDPVVLVGEAGAGARLVVEDLHGRRGAPGQLVTFETGTLAEAAERAHMGTLFVPDVEMLGGFRLRELRQLVEAAPPVRIVLGLSRREGLATLESLGAALSGRCLVIPPLSERRHDIGRLLGRALETACRRYNREPAQLQLSRGAARTLFTHQWPGGYAELQAACDCAVANMAGDLLLPNDLPSWLQKTGGDGEDPASETAPLCTDAPPAGWLLQGSPAERASTLRALLAVFGGNVSALARWVGRSRRQVHRWIREECIDASEFRRA